MNASTHDPVRDRLVAIEAQIRTGELAAAAAELDRARAAAPGDVRVCLVEAALARAENDVVKEIAVLKRAIALAPRWPVAHIALCKALARAENYDEALPAAERMVAAAPDDLAVLEVAVAVANVAGAYAVAERHLRTALKLRPGDVAIVRPLALCLFNQKRYAEAEPFYRIVSAALPDSPRALVSLGACLAEIGKTEEAIRSFEHALELSPGDSMIEFRLEIARGQVPRTQPNELTRMLFDDYANRFDKHLAGSLKYRVPERVADIVRERRPQRDIDVLDLGCGTGLTGANLGKVGGVMVGVDLSEKMLERARRLGLYTELRQNDLRHELRASPANSYDCVIANDVFIYVGDIDDVIAATYPVLRCGGALIFSCETAADDEGDFVIRPSKRYAHSRAYIERLCRAAGFDSVGFEHLDLRMEEGVPIPGFIAVADKT